MNTYRKTQEIIDLETFESKVWIKQKLENNNKDEAIAFYALCVIDSKGITSDEKTKKIKALLDLGMDPNTGSAKYRREILKIGGSSNPIPFSLLGGAVHYNITSLAGLLLSYKSINPRAPLTLTQPVITPWNFAKTTEIVNEFLKHPDCIKDKQQAEMVVDNIIDKDICTQTLLEHPLINFFTVSEKNSYLFIGGCPLKECFLRYKPITISVLYNKYGKDLFNQCAHCNPKEILHQIEQSQHNSENKKKRKEWTIQFLKKNFCNDKK